MSITFLAVTRYYFPISVSFLLLCLASGKIPDSLKFFNSPWTPHSHRPRSRLPRLSDRVRTLVLLMFYCSAAGCIQYYIVHITRISYLKKIIIFFFILKMFAITFSIVNSMCLMGQFWEVWFSYTHIAKKNTIAGVKVRERELCCIVQSVHGSK